jgi:hypothetical protein
MTIDRNKSTIDNAYLLWQAHAATNDRETTDELTSRISDRLFYFRKDNGSWLYKVLAYIFSDCVKTLVTNEVLKALSAYKFDLIISNQAGIIDNTKGLFTPHELTCIAKTHRAVFKKILDRSDSPLSNESKAARWAEKVNKYHHKSRYMLASSALEIIARRYPKYANLINSYLKKLAPSIIEDKANWLLSNRIAQQVLANLLGREDFTYETSIEELLRMITHEGALESSKSLSAANPILLHVTTFLESERFNPLAPVSEIARNAVREVGRAFPILTPITNYLHRAEYNPAESGKKRLAKAALGITFEAGKIGWEKTCRAVISVGQRISNAASSAKDSMIGWKNRLAGRFAPVLHGF